MESEKGSHYSDWLYAPILGWNRGIQLATSARERFPEQMHIVRYEDMVQESESTLKTLFDFVDIPFDASYLGVPHVNAAENPGQDAEKKTSRKGLDSSRVFYYEDVLNASQIRAACSLVDDDDLQKMYPELADETLSARARNGSWWKTQSYKAVCGTRLLHRNIRDVIQSPGYATRRIWRRTKHVASGLFGN